MRGRLTLDVVVGVCLLALTACTPPAPTPVSTTTAPITPTDSTANALPALPRITVNRTSIVDGKELMPAAQVAGVQAFADDLADGNIDTVVSHCWTYAPIDVRQLADSRERILGLLSRPVQDMVGTGWLWADQGTVPGGGEAGNGLVPSFTYEAAASSYACFNPNGFSPAQAALVIQRIVDWHNGTPYNGTDTAADVFFLACENAANVYGDVPGEIAADVNAHAPGAVAVCQGVLGPQWPVLTALAGRSLVFADSTTFGLDPSYVVATPDPADGRYVVFHTLSGLRDAGTIHDLVLVALGDTTHLNQPHVQVNRTFATGGGNALATWQLAAVQRFADDVADGNVHSIVTNCWTQAEVDVEAKWSDPAVRTQALTWLSQPVTSDDPGGNPVVWPVVWGPSSGGLAFTRESLTRDYACPMPDDFTGAQALLTIQRLLARHDGTPLHAGDTAANYPQLSCDEPNGLDGWWMMQLGTWSNNADYVCAGPAKGKPIETQCLSCSGTSEKQWTDLQQYVAMEMKQGNTLKLIPASTIGLNDDLFRLVQGPFTPYWVLFAITSDGHYPLIAIGSTAG